MGHPSNLLIVSFSSDNSLRWKMARRRFARQARIAGIDSRVFTPSDLPDPSSHSLQSSWVSDFPEGYGLWFWKPVILAKTIEDLLRNQVTDYDFIAYCDIGCEIFDTPYGRARLEEWKSLLAENTGLFFKLEHLEKDYTSSRTFDVMPEDVISGRSLLNEQQIMATFFILKVHNDSLDLCNLWARTCFENNGYALRLGSEFLSHRHDQSVLSLLVKSRKGFTFLEDETYLGALSREQIPLVVSSRRKGFFSAVGPFRRGRSPFLARVETLFFAFLNKLSQFRG